MSFHDTILALSSPPPAPEAPRAILRLSGPDAWPLAQQLLPGLALRVGYRPELAVPLLYPRLPVAAALLFHAPRSFTGEDVAELHLPNSPALIAACSAAILRFGPGKVRPANPGEFSARAFFNGKIDLTEAEGIAATIHAADQRERRAAAGLRNGALHHAIDALAQQIADTLALVEAGIDFTEEEGVSFIAAGELLARLTRLADHLQTQIESSCRIDRLDTLPTVVFVGRPNVGKSSLINALAGSARSITSPIAGTTRDMLAVLMPTPVGPIRLLDVPGEEAPTDELRRKMMDARAGALLDADLAIDVVTDAARVVASVAAPVSHGPLTFRVQNKADLLSPDVRESNTGAREPWQLVSATTGYHLAELRAAIARFAARHEPAGQYTLTLNQRHRALLVQTLQTLHAAIGHAAQDSAGAHPELLASHLRQALDLLGQITGTISPDEILGRIFSTFCIGK